MGESLMGAGTFHEKSPCEQKESWPVRHCLTRFTSISVSWRRGKSPNRLAKQPIVPRARDRIVHAPRQAISGLGVLYPGSPEAKARPWQHICYRLCCCAGPVAVVMLFG